MAGTIHPEVSEQTMAATQDTILEAFPDLDRGQAILPPGSRHPGHPDRRAGGTFQPGGLPVAPRCFLGRGNPRPPGVLRPLPGRGGRPRLEQLLHQRLARAAAHPVGPGLRTPHPGLRAGPAGQGPHLLGHPLLLQDAGRRQSRGLAPGRLLLAADPQQDRDRLAGHRRRHRRKRRHAGHSDHPSAGTGRLQRKRCRGEQRP